MSIILIFISWLLADLEKYFNPVYQEEDNNYEEKNCVTAIENVRVETL